MKFLIVSVFAITFICGVLCAPQGDPNGVTILRYDNDQTENEGYKFV